MSDDLTRPRHTGSGLSLSNVVELRGIIVHLLDSNSSIFKNLRDDHGLTTLTSFMLCLELFMLSSV